MLKSGRLLPRLFKPQITVLQAESRSPQMPQSLWASARGITLVCPQFGQIDAFMPTGTKIGSGFLTGGQPLWVPGK